MDEACRGCGNGGYGTLEGVQQRNTCHWRHGGEKRLCAEGMDRVVWLGQVDVQNLVSPTGLFRSLPCCLAEHGSVGVRSLSCAVRDSNSAASSILQRMQGRVSTLEPPERGAKCSLANGTAYRLLSIHHGELQVEPDALPARLVSLKERATGRRH